MPGNTWGTCLQVLVYVSSRNRWIRRHLCAIIGAYNSCQIRHGTGFRRTLFRNLYGVQVVAGSNPVAPT